MESKLDDPGARSDFRYDLSTYPKEHRMELLSHGLTILRAFIQAGCPPQAVDNKPLVPMASFEEWSKVVRGAVVWVTGHDPLATRKQLQQVADRGRTAAAILVAEMHTTFPGEFTARAVAERLYANLLNHVELREALEELCEVKPGQRVSPVQVGTQFRKLRNRVFGGLWLELVQEGDQNKSGKWVIAKDLE
jgi:putative DNA primase/helicase